jgi:hypothetical protein
MFFEDDVFIYLFKTAPYIGVKGSFVVVLFTGLIEANQLPTLD